MTQKSDFKNPILVINCGSSSLKFAVVTSDNAQPVHGLAQNLGQPQASLSIYRVGQDKKTIDIANNDHQQALKILFEQLKDLTPIAIGHRVVHGGEAFTGAVLIDDDVLSAIELTSPLAPLHNPANLQGISATKALFPDLPQVAVFDTAFHQTMPPKAYRYALANSLYHDHGIRRYGFHGTSHAYISQRADALSTTTGNGWLTAHLGNGCSTAAVYQGRSLDTSMGLTPLEGVAMGTRSGDVDPGLHAHLHRSLGMSIDEIDDMLNNQSGLLGLSGLSNDLRKIMAAKDSPDHESQTNAQLAVNVFCYRIAKSLAGLSCALPKLSGIIFTGGIGENAAQIRDQVVSQLPHFGIRVDHDANRKLSGGKQGTFHQNDSAVSLWVIPTDEEGQIAHETRTLL